MKKISFLLYASIVFISACNNDKKEETVETTAAIPAPSVMNYTVAKIYPHDSTSYTEGLQLFKNELYESAGQYGESRIQKTDLATGSILKKSKQLSKDFFGEGITVLNNKIYQLTYKEHKVFIYDMNLNKLPEELSWPYEGWGMTTDGTYLILNTGGSNIYFVDPATFKIVRTLGVVDNNGYVDSINELEYYNGYLYANRYMTNYILKINAQTGYVESKADLTGILEKNNLPSPMAKDPGNVLNGIAYDSTKGSFYVTGKYWPAIFEVKFN